MSGPTPAHGEDTPREGYYPDPSIPGYVRYWNGASWVPGTSRPAPQDGESLAPPPGVRSAAPAVEETGPHFFDEDPASVGQEPEPSDQEPASAWGADPARQSGFAGEQDRRVSWGSEPHAASDAPGGPDAAARAPQAAPADDVADGTMMFRRVPGGSDQAAAGPAAGNPAAGDEGTMMFRAVQRRPGRPQAPQGDAAGLGVQGPVGAGGPAPAPGAGPAPAAYAEGQPQPGPAAPQVAQAPSIPQQANAPMSSGPGGGQASWAQQVHRLAGAGADQPVAPWKPPVEDIFQAAARRQAAARPAALGKRLAARLIDSVVIGGVTAVAAVPLGIEAADHVQAKIDAAKLSGRTVTVWLLDGTTSAYLGIVLGLLLVVGVLYEVLPTAKWGRTLGKKVCGLQVRDIEGHEPPDFGPSLIRWLVQTLPTLLGIGILGLAWCLFDRPWHQCWHDKASHTFVAG
ncbi:RDD family protein [Streptomyces sp. V3I7]|uniref:RDD family protein n=1 Tax=Streptomyces sp. V3I7 TaxID=3042278 RepID=UPI00278012D0|nr:RDD family protein [Streptomyces sp. V3I7]MDQ0991167.1 putative RDD family membrane protein YckC [Streptomyces sp. V3I7]